MPDRVRATWVPPRWEHFDRGLTQLDWAAGKPLRAWLNTLLAEHLNFHDGIGDRSVWVGEDGSDFSGVAQVLPYHFEGKEFTRANHLAQLGIKPVDRGDAGAEEQDLDAPLLTLMTNYPGLMLCDPETSFWVSAFAQRFNIKSLAGTALTRRYFLG